MNPSIWGPSAWLFLHTITIAYPTCPTNEDKANIKNFFMSLQYILPCPTCKNNYKNHIKELPLTDNILNSREKLIKWLIDLHNLVNKENNKKELTYDQVQNIYSDIYGYNNKQKIFKFYLILCIFTIIIVIASIVFWKKI
jgi:mitochondrial FAD-linked sulfhydryl oxidase